MPELRWTLLIIGVLFIVILAVWERRRPHQASRQAPHIGEDPRPVVTDSWDSPAAREPSLTLPEIRTDARTDVRSPPPPPPPVHFQREPTSPKDLMVEVDRTVSHMKDEAANFPDPNDRATQEEEFSLELRTRDRERKLIRKIDEALKRIEDGSYGYCLETGEEIGVKRLEARPVATLSIEAQERRERRERQYGDRDDRYR